MRPVSDRPRLSTLLLACLVVGAVFVVIRQSASPHKPPGPHSAPSPQPPAVTVTDVRHPILGVTSDWQLFGLSSANLVEVQLQAGRITRTILPQQEGSGPVSFIVGPHQAIIRPLDDVPGYVVPDGRPARPLAGILARGDLLLPGPRPAEEWVVSGSGNTLPLLGPHGQATSVRVTLPRRWPAQSAMADGRGDVLVFDDHGRQFDARPGLLRPVRALLVAIGPKRWLGLSCQHGRCRNVVIDAATGTRRLLAGPPVSIVTWPWPWQPGVVSPDGATAAVIEAGGRGHVFLNLVDLASGVATTIGAPMAQTSSSQMLAWSPDSRWLLVVDADGHVVAVNRVSHRIDSLGVPLPHVSQIAVRPPPG